MGVSPRVSLVPLLVPTLFLSSDTTVLSQIKPTDSGQVSLLFLPYHPDRHYILIHNIEEQARLSHALRDKNGVYQIVG